MASAVPPASTIDSTVAVTPASSRSTATMRAPCAAKSRALARPMPPPAPVTMAHLSRKRLFGDDSSGMRPDTHACPRAASNPIGRLVEPLGRERKHLRPGLGYPDRVLELRGERPVAGDGRPAVREHFDVRPNEIDHRLNGKKHARFELDTLSGAANMDDVGLVVEQPPQSMAAEIAHHAHVLGLDIALNGGADVAGRGARPDRINAAHHRLVGHADEPVGAPRDLADRKHPARIPVPPI